MDPHIPTNFLNKEVNDVSATTENTSKVKLELPDDLKQAILEIVKLKEKELFIIITFL